MVMLAVLVSGVVIHKRILADFFTFRPRKALGRSILDLHNLTGVLALPFHFIITLSGLAILISCYFPQAPGLVYTDRASPANAYFEEAIGAFQRPRSEQRAALPHWMLCCNGRSGPGMESASGTCVYGIPATPTATSR